MSNEYPFYPTLNEPGEQDATERINRFVEQLKSAAQEAIDNFYCEDLPHIESDSWQNFRNQIVAGFQNYGNSKVQAEYDFAKIRKAIYKEFKDDIIKDLNQDNLKRISELEQQVKQLQELRKEESRIRY